jgi:sorbitol-specific phosphotransferase system component IIC
MTPAFVSVTVLFALMTALSALLKIRLDPKVVKSIHETVGVPMKFFPHLAACEIAGALGLVIGIWSPPLGVTAGSGLVLYFIGAIVSHLRVGDVKGIGSAAFMFGLSVASVALRIATM